MPLLSNGKVGSCGFPVAGQLLERRAKGLSILLPCLLDTAAAERRETAQCLSSTACTQLLDCVLASETKPKSLAAALQILFCNAEKRHSGALLLLL